MAKTRRRSSASVQTPLETYLREINETALLSAHDEQELAVAIGAGDIRARDRMVRANLRLVVNIARGYSGKGLGLRSCAEEHEGQSENGCFDEPAGNGQLLIYATEKAVLERNLPHAPPAG